MALTVSPRAANRYGFKCACCLLHKPKGRFGRQRDTERRNFKRKERAEVIKEMFLDIEADQDEQAEILAMHDAWALEWEEIWLEHEERLFGYDEGFTYDPFEYEDDYL